MLVHGMLIDDSDYIGIKTRYIPHLETNASCLCDDFFGQSTPHHIQQTRALTLGSGGKSQARIGD